MEYTGLTYEYLFESRSLDESGFLLARGKVLESVEREGLICWFVFQDKESCEKLVRQYRFGTSDNVNAREFFEAVQKLKSLIFSRRDKP